ncbi:histone acetyltransferases subunit 3 domain-containing protein [Hirsutella rhossiliensis]|uniref:Histone acetyltransferases subunit 3 domain-containing protein n=1 Tax=Hirsutella rhossiliensis TaxID=111463 RepID=A0A9P8MXS0_9HYPO|nr:histone acetyltransferases subunit 3 domain-containing protein [Hirsutella rhossiliensis]KAH0962339.1 histone acetyltransferases subunit 3 domain-containing protein [Hirsutella rhossiliensis]
MPSGPGQSGPGKKNAGLPKQSRNSTPAPAPASLPPQEFYDPDYLNTRVILFQNLKYDDLVDQGASNATVPDSKSVDAMLDKLKSLVNIMEKRSTFYDRGMRHLADERKKRPDDYDHVEPEGKRTKHKRKKGSESLAPGDADQSSPLRDAKRKHSRDGSASSSLSPIAAASPSAMDVDKKKPKKAEKKEESSSEDEGAPPRRELPQSQTFGEDPSTFPDPTVYEIRDIQPGMSDEEKKTIYSVACYPRSDLADLIAGDPPDKDFSSAKPTSQINFTTFSSYIDPYFRPFSEEDLAFLRERGDRVTPFVMPKRGKRHYSEVWAEEDGAMSLDSPQQGREKLPPNQPRGSIENMNDSVGETDGLSIGPLASRLLQILRPESRAQLPEDRPATNGTTNGDVSVNGDANGDEQPNGNGDDKGHRLPPATYMTESSSEAWKKATHPKLEYAQVDERLKQELRHIGFLPQEGFEGDYDGHFDDEIAGRMRVLQARLREQVLINGARKARLMELVRERMAHQEYQTILEDLDSQVQAAYLKRTRTMGKSKKTKRPGGAGGGSHMAGGAAGTARPGIGDLTRTLMERRRRWIDTIGSVFDDESLNKVPRVADADSSIFRKDDMAALVKKEKELWDDEVEE